MNHYVYRIDRPATGEFYIGIRSCTCDPGKDAYMGSGTALKAKMTGRQSEFTKTILAIVQTRTEAAHVEAALVGPSQIENPLCMNLVEGGDAGVLGLKHSKTTRSRMSASASKRWSSPCARTRQAIRRFGKKHSAATKAAYSNARRGELHPAAVLTETLVFRMRQQRISGMTIRQIATLHNINYVTAGQAIRGNSWGSVPFPDLLEEGH